MIQPIGFATYHLEGEAQLWYQLLKSEGEITWANLKEGLYARYGPTEFDDNFGDLTKLKQIGTVREYQGHFERLLSCVGRLPPSQQVCCFISGLKDHLRMDVQALKPISLSIAVGLARLYEAKCHSQQRILPSRENEESLRLSLSTGKTIKKLTPI
ncbi:Retrovirus-related Pol polyprotein from transposon 297 [Fagus crenata]